MAATCGNCNEPVREGDTTCVHCGALLAAYASPVGAVTTTPDYSPPAYATPPTVTGSVREETTPEPLFDTYVTIEEVSMAADLDHPVELLLAGVEIPGEAEVGDAVADAEETDTAGHSWPDPVPSTRAAKPGPAREVEPVPPTRAAKPGPVREVDGVPAGPGEAEHSWPDPVTLTRVVNPDPAREVEPVPAGAGETEAYLRTLHKRAGYTADTGTLSAPVTTRRATPADRVANREAREAANRNRPHATPAPVPGPTRILGIIVIIFWAGVLLSAMAGNVSLPAVIFTVLLTMWLKSMTNKDKR